MERQRRPVLDIVGRDEAIAAVRGMVPHYINTVAEAYILHAQRLTENPPSRSLRVPGRASDRAIALPAYVGSDRNVWGMTWIASVPGNNARGIPPASGVVVLNDPETGFPIACVEASVVNAVRTAASAALGARYLSPDGPTEAVLGIVGAGHIAGSTLDYLLADGWTFGRVLVFDPDRRKLAGLHRQGPYQGMDLVVCESAERVAAESDVILFATTVSEPHIRSLAGGPTVLHLSLRDLGVEAIRASQNIVDDVDMCLTEATSLQLTEAALGHRDFVDGTIVDMMTGLVRPDPSRPRVFSPFGMGILDVMVADEIHRHAAANGHLLRVEDFFGGSVVGVG
nr:2,3-diaminopropionate biosynthesis protein SbnB [Micromonospora sp. DSM 115978]